MTKMDMKMNLNMKRFSRRREDDETRGHESKTW